MSKNMTGNEKKLVQAKHRLEEAEMRDRQKERKARTRRLIQEGAILEKGSFHSQYLRYFNNVGSAQSPRPFPFMGKGAALEDICPRHAAFG